MPPSCPLTVGCDPATPHRYCHSTRRSASAGPSYLDRIASTAVLQRTPPNASHRRPVETHNFIDISLKYELRDTIEYDVSLDNFIGKLLMPSDLIRRKSLHAIIDRVQSLLLRRPSTPLPLPTPIAPVVSRDYLTAPDGHWLVNNSWPNGYSENVFLPYFCQLFYGLSALAKKAAVDLVDAGHEPLPLPDRVYLENRGRYVEDAPDVPEAKRKLDWYVCDRSTTHLRWDAVHMYADMKKCDRETDDDNRWELDYQMASYARELVHAQLDRIHVHGMCVRNATVWLYRWDRLGALVSAPFDFQRDWVTMLHVVLAYVYMDPMDMGRNHDYRLNPAYQPPPPPPPPAVPSSSTAATASHSTPPTHHWLASSIPSRTTSPAPSSTPAAWAPPLPADHDKPAPMTLSENPPPGRYVLRIGEQDYVLNRTLDRQKSLIGRATACWVARSTDSTVVTDFVVKTSWLQTAQNPEEMFYRLAKESGIHGLMDLVAAITRPSTVRQDRRGLWGKFTNSDGNVSRKRKFSATTVPSLLDHNGPFPSKRRRLAQSGMVTGGKYMRKHDKNTAEQSPLHLVDAGEDPPRPQLDRVFTALVFRSAVGLPLSQVTSPVHLFKAIRTALDLHRRLYTGEAGILHSDISASNILATVPDTWLTLGHQDDAHHHHHHPEGFLIDFDYATTKQQRVAASADHCTGTLMFLAVSVLRDLPNSYRSDLESFFYVMCYICTHFPAAEEQALMSLLARETSRHHDADIAAYGPLANWVKGDKKTITGAKYFSMRDKQVFQVTVLDRVTPTFAPAKPLLSTLRLAVIRSEWFEAFEKRDRVLEGKKRARLKRREWIERRGEPEKEGEGEGEGEGDEPDPLIAFNEKIIAEEDHDAHMLYKEMIEHIDASVEGWEGGAHG